MHFFIVRRMENLRNCSIFLALLCTFLISDTFSSPIHGKKGHRGCYRSHYKHYIYKRAVDEQLQIADLPSKMSLDDPQVQLYAQKGIEKLAETLTGPTDPVLEKILEATFFPPAGKLLYEIKMEVASKKNKDVSQECKVNVWRESDAEPSVTVECGQARRRRADEQPQIADLPSKMSLDDPLVKLYAQKGIEKLEETLTGPTDPVLEKILEATFFPPAGKLLYEIKMKVASKKTKDVSQECKVNVWRESDAEPSVTVECGQARRRRADGDQSQIADLLTELSIDDPEVKKFAQEAADKFGSPLHVDKKAIVQEIRKAISYPSTGKLVLKIEMQLGSTNCSKGSDELNCVNNPEDDSTNCEVDVLRETDAEPTLKMECTNVLRRRRDAEETPKIPNLPKNVSIDDPEVKKYAQNAVDRFGTPIDEDKKAILREINQAVLYSRDEKDSYTIKIRVGVTNCTKESEETNCKHNPEKDDVDCELYISSKKGTDKELSQVIECKRAARERREVTESDPQIADLPITLSIDDPKVKEYAQIGLEQMGGHSSGMKGNVREIVEAKSYPPSGKLLYTVNFKIGSTNCSKESNEKNCENDPEASDDNCEVHVLRETDVEPTIKVVCNSILRRRRNSADALPQVLDLPTKSSVDDPQVQMFAQKGIEKLSETSTGPSEPTLMKILEATSFPPAGKLMREIKIEVGSNENKDISQECTVNVWRESDAEPSVTVECGQVRKRRADDGQPQIADLPTTLSIDDPKVKEYAQVALDKIGGHSSGMKGIVREIVEAKSYPPSGKIHFTVKLKIGATKCPKGSNEKNCEYDPEAGDDNCEISVLKKTDEEDSTRVQCWRIDRKKRADDDDDDEESVGPLILDKPLQVSIDDPEVKKYAQKGVEIYTKSSTGPNEPILEKIDEALMFPPVGTLSLEIKIKIGTSTCAVGQKENCELKTDGESKSCTVKVFIESEKPRVELECN